MTSASDVYAAGVVLYEALTLRRPHEADEALDVLRLVGSATAVPVQEREPSLPAALVALVGSLLDPVPRLRPSAATAAAALREMARATR